MLTSSLLAVAASLAGVDAVTKGFNYGSLNSDNSPKTYDEFKSEFNEAKSLPGTNGFTSARLYTMLQGGGTSITSAIQAAIDTNTRLMLGIWGSAGDSSVQSEISALQGAISQYGSKFTSLVDSIAVGSEDLYRNSVLGVQAKAGIGANPDVIANYIKQVKSSLSSTALSSTPVGHVDTWTAWVNSSNNAVISASDFIGFDAYPYFQNTMANSISDSVSLFQSAYAQTVAAVNGKPIIVTETGFPVSGPVSNLAQPSIDNAKYYWQQVGCALLFDKMPTYWFTLVDATPVVPSPSFGVADSSGKPLFDLSCSNVTNTTSLTSPSNSTSTGSSGSLVTSTGSSGSSSSNSSSSSSGSSGSSGSLGSGTGSSGTSNSSYSGPSISGPSTAPSSSVLKGAAAAAAPATGLLAAVVALMALA